MKNATKKNGKMHYFKNIIEIQKQNKIHILILNGVKTNGKKLKHMINVVFKKDTFF